MTLLKNSVEILTCTLDSDVGVTLGTISDSLSLTFGDDIVFSQDIADTFEIDDESATSQMQNGYWSFRLPDIDPGYQTGMYVTYTEVNRYILSVAVSWSGDSGSVTLTEGAQPPDDDTVDGDPGMPGCTSLITVGQHVNSSFSTFCSSGYGSLYEYFMSPEGYYYDVYVFVYRQFSIPAEADITIEFNTGKPGLSFDGTAEAASGFEFDLIQGVYTPFTNPAPTIYTFRGDGEFNGTLPEGIYTCRMTLYVNRPDDSVGWLSSAYQLHVQDVS